MDFLSGPLSGMGGGQDLTDNLFLLFSVASSLFD